MPGTPGRCPGKNAFCVRSSIANNRKSLGHRTVDPCLSRRVSVSRGFSERSDLNLSCLCISCWHLGGSVAMDLIWGQRYLRSLRIRPYKGNTVSQRLEGVEIKQPVTSFGGLFWGLNSRKEGEPRSNNQELGKKNPKMQQKPPRFCGGFWWPFLTLKLGIFWDFGHFYAHQSRLQP